MTRNVTIGYGQLIDQINIMKTKIISIISTAALISGVTFSFVSAEEVRAVNTRAEDATEVRTVNTTNTEERDGVRGNATSTMERNKNEATSTKDNADENNREDNNGQFNAESHRSAVATFVQSLLKIADREGGIGAQVREVAQAQNDSASTSEKAIKNVEDKGKIQTFLFGSDYKSLGQLRSEMVKTDKDIQKLNTLLTQVTNLADKTELQNQISKLTDTKTKVDAFVQEHEGSFSLFGWLVKAFAN